MSSAEKEQKGLLRREFLTGVAAGALGGLAVGAGGTALLTIRAEPKWAKVADVVVVGGGGTGCMAAVSAAQSGAKVILVESAPVIGGCGSLCIGSVTAPLSSLQKKAGITDSVEGYIKDVPGNVWGKRQPDEQGAAPVPSQEWRSHDRLASRHGGGHPRPV